jgi:hypothetical protein
LPSVMTSRVLSCIKEGSSPWRRVSIESVDIVS